MTYVEHYSNTINSVLCVFGGWGAGRRGWGEFQFLLISIDHRKHDASSIQLFMLTIAVFITQVVRSITTRRHQLKGPQEVNLDFTIAGLIALVLLKILFV